MRYVFVYSVYGNVVGDLLVVLLMSRSWKRMKLGQFIIHSCSVNTPSCPNTVPVDPYR